MRTQKINPRFIVLTLFMLAVAVLRITNAAALLPFSNFTPLGAMGLFGGAYFSKNWKAFAFPLLTLLASDLIIQVFIYKGKYGILYSSWYWVYGGFCIIVLLGKLLLQKISVKNVLVSGLLATLLYWLIVDFGVFLVGCTDISTGQTMDHSLQSLVKCYLQGMPYMKNFLAGTWIYSGIMFGAFEWMKKTKPALAGIEQ